ncbi:hypothetical protein [Haloferula sargassicola]|uniref:Uncharacterized protein n=1 Tax=Haloferula sargassicola TaxID=490096 RepID=A0ABP9UQM2_9BACT
MADRPRKASAEVRAMIREALADPRRRFLDDKTSSRNWLNHWNLKAEGLYQDLIDGLGHSENLFLKPKSKPAQIQAYQCVLDYPADGGDLPAVDIHVTLAPKGDPPRVRVAVHPSDTVQTLPRLDPKPNDDEND